MPYQWFEKQANGSLKSLTLVGEYIDEFTGTKPLSVSYVGDPYIPQTPLAPTVTATQPTRTSVSVSWVPALFDGPPVTSWDVQRRSSTDDGVTFGSWAAITGSPFDDAVLSTTDSGLSSGTPEHIFQYRIRGVNGDGNGDWSAAVAVQWNGTPAAPPARPTSLVVKPGTLTPTSVTVQWQETPDLTVDKHTIYTGNTILRDNLSATATEYTFTGLAPGQTLSNLNVRRSNEAGESSGSNWIDVTTPTQQTTFAPLMGCSNSSRDHGGTYDWDAWRVYSFSDALERANVTGASHPKVLGVTDSGNSLARGDIYTSRQSAYNNWSAWLERFYYTDPGAASRQDVELHIANGNEYGDKPTSSTLAGFIQGCQGIYDATRITNPDGTRRYPLASAWLDPTHNQEHESILKEEGDPAGNIPLTLKETIYPVVQYLDGIAWSMYPPGRESTSADPTFDYPSFDPDLPYNTALPALQRSQRGFLMRCFRRTFDAQYPTTNPYLTDFRALKIACWEIGIGDDPDDQTTRPWYAVHAMVASMRKLCEIFSLDMPVICWWDNQVGYPTSTNSQNILSDEVAPTGDQVSTRVAWQNWKQYSHWDGGTHPTSWNGNPKSTWKNRSATWLTEWLNDMNA
jgi:hypothetical protein